MGKTMNKEEEISVCQKLIQEMRDASNYCIGINIITLNHIHHRIYIGINIIIINPIHHRIYIYIDPILPLPL